MKAPLRKLARVLARWPIIGRLIRIAVALVRLPEHNERQHVFAAEQLPTLLATISDLNARLLAVTEEPNNLSQSLPVTLRQLTRELAELRLRLDRLEAGGGQ
jgi:hypothetical protein